MLVKRFDIYIELIIYMSRFIIFDYIFWHVLIDKLFFLVYTGFMGLAQPNPPMS